jgi:pyridoxine kinase
MPRYLAPDVGNKSAVFPLQLLGFDVDVINSVQFSNHTGYPNGFEGDVLKGDQLRALLNGLQRNDLLPEIGHVLTGYIGSASFLEGILDVLQTVRASCSSSNRVRYVCDPVLGDAGKFYAPPELVPLYRDRVIPLADIVTPNQFEVEQLTGIVIKTLEDALRACQVLHDMGPPIVFITSLEFNLPDDDNSDADDRISILASECRECIPIVNDDDVVASRTANAWTIDCPKISGSFVGTGDLTAALILAHSATIDLVDDSSIVPSVMEKVANTMYEVIRQTAELSGATMQSRELRLVSCKKVIENPPQRFHAKRVV